MIRLPYYPGCALKTTARNFGVSGIAVAKRLEIELIELPRWNCCGVFPSLVSDDLMRHLSPLRNLISAQKMIKSRKVKNEKRLVTFCSMCYHTLKEAANFFKDAGKLEKINSFLEREKELPSGLKEGYGGNVEIMDFLEVLRDLVGFEKIASNVKRPLKGIKVAPYYGCFVLRPREIAIDDPENPTILEDLLETLGAEVIDNPNRNQCCGSYHTVDRKEIVAKLTYDNLILPINQGAELIATCCPLCTFNLDFRQKEAKKFYRDFEEIPIMYYTQLMAIAFGLNKRSFGIDLNLHHVDPSETLRRMELI